MKNVYHRNIYAFECSYKVDNPLAVNRQLQLAAAVDYVVGQHIVKNDIFHKAVAVVLFVIVLLDCQKVSAEKGSIAFGKLVSAFAKDNISIFIAGFDFAENIAAAHIFVVVCFKMSNHGLVLMTDHSFVAAGDDVTAVIHDTDFSVNILFQLIACVLKYSVLHLNTSV